MTTCVKLHLEDYGQDFTTFTVLMDEDGHEGTIVDTQPVQGWVWNGRKLTAGSMKAGRFPVFAEPVAAVLRYPIVDVEPVAVPSGGVTCRKIGARVVERVGLCQGCEHRDCPVHSWNDPS